MGIIEPIVHALRNAIEIIPDKMIGFTSTANQSNEFHLIYRLNLAARSMFNGADFTNYACKLIYETTSAKIIEMLDEVFLNELDVDMKRIREEHKKSTNL